MDDWLAEQQLRDAGRGHLTRDGAAAILNMRALPASELCPECGQPDNCGDCNHQPLTEEQAARLRGET